MDRRGHYDELLKIIQSQREGFLNQYNCSVSKEQFSDPTGMKDACWPKVLSHLPLGDLLKLSQSHPFFAATVDQFFSSGNPATIDESLDGDGHITTAHDRLALFRIGMFTTNLIVSGIENADSVWLCVFFHGVTHLTWENMESVSDLYGMVVKNIIHLKIANCRLGIESLGWWLYQLLVPLPTIHFDRLSLTIMDECPDDLAIPIPEVRHLIVEKSDIDFDYFSFNGLESLQIITSNVSRLFRFTETDRSRSTDKKSSVDVLLRDYALESSWDKLDDGSALRDLHSNFAPLKIDNILKWTQLEHVNIHCNWYHADQLRTHFASLESIKSCIVTCSTPSPGYDLWDSLNEDCLRMITSYLTDTDLNNLLFADPRLIALHSVVRH